MNTKLRQLIRESINEYIREIDEAGNVAALEAKMGKTQEAIELREKKMNMDGLDEAYHDMLDKGKMKELGNEVKALKKSLAKYEKQLDKLKNKGNKAEKIETEEKEIVDENTLSENEEDFNLEVYFQKANKEYSWDFDANTKVEGDLEYGDESWERKFAKRLMSIGELPYNEWKVKANKAYNASQTNESLEEDTDIYETLYMQKLAGIISETEYKAKVEEARFKKGTDIGKKGKGFSKIAKSAAKEYGSEEAGKRVAGSILKKVLAKKGK